MVIVVDSIELAKQVWQVLVWSTTSNDAIWLLWQDWHLSMVQSDWLITVVVWLTIWCERFYKRQATFASPVIFILVLTKMEQHYPKRKISHFCLKCSEDSTDVNVFMVIKARALVEQAVFDVNTSFELVLNYQNTKKNEVHKSCNICNLNFCRLIDYHHHQKDEHGINPYKCTTC